MTTPLFSQITCASIPRPLLAAFLVAATACGLPAQRMFGAPAAAAFMEMVKVPAGYSVGKYDVTQAQYEAVMGKNPSVFKGPRQPVENINWEEATKFCERLTEMETKAGRLPPGLAYSLPTDQQWEYFVGGASLADAVTSAKARRSAPLDVGSLRPNKFGLYDVRGNVWQWCLSPIEPESFERVIRGGSFSNAEPEKLAIDYRFGLTPLYRGAGIGFRCVLERQ